jgi:hypothetical protein
MLYWRFAFDIFVAHIWSLVLRRASSVHVLKSSKLCFGFEEKYTIQVLNEESYPVVLLAFASYFR